MKLSRRDVLKKIGVASAILSAHETGFSRILAAPASPTVRPPLPTVQPPGAVQPLAPGYRRVAPLPQISLEPPVPGVKKIEFASNGFIEVAHALILDSRMDAGAQADLELAQTVAGRVFQARPSLTEVDISVYASGSYEGFGGPLPRFTASVPRARLDEFARLETKTVSGYDRLWFNPGVMPVRRKPQDTLELAPTFYGPPSALRGQQVKQLASQLGGGVRGGLYFHGDPNKPLAGLTFDDAPHPLYEPLLLDSLRRGGVKATFFVIGRNAVSYPYFVRDMVSAGHEIGNHTFHHVRLPPLSDTDVRDELDGCNRVLQHITGKPVRYFRPPGGDYSAATLKIASSLGLVTTFWTDDPGDFDNPGDAIIESRLTRKLRAGGIVLLHDNVLQSIQVLPTFLNVARKRQIELITMGRLDASDGSR